MEHPSASKPPSGRGATRAAILKGLALCAALAGAAWAAAHAAGTGSSAASQAMEESTMSLTISSPAFDAGGSIPVKYTCDGQDISPPLRWSGVPDGAKSLVLIVDDPDAPDPKAPKMTWVHWVLYNLPPESRGLPEQVSAEGLPAGTQEGLNDWKRSGYGGPCPPIGRHRYFIKLYALDKELPHLGTPTKSQVENAMDGHVLAEGALMATYERHR